ncbi:energy transducer TonB [Flavobacterium aestivum]|uniref:energy transducer TonB n=1 Tax=Flavobacterium aestivum TaxID=3003257 RepID=UPI002285789D|nr:energy transducer TonB [Flavobacterium aestivum]
MSKLSIYETNWIDLVFENRNKEYGAYPLRQENTKTSLTALFTGALLLTSAISLPMVYNYLNPEHRIAPSIPLDTPVTLVDLTTYVPPKTEVEKTVMPEIKRPITENINTDTKLINPEIVHSDLATTEIATNVELKNTTSNNTEGAVSTGLDTTAPTGTSTGVSTPSVPDNTIVSSAVLDKMPEFPGGIKKFYTYVGNNFEKPELESESEIRVNVSFVIEKDGSMTDIKVLKDPGYGLGTEAIRVLKSLKTKWAPGMIEGKAVRTAYNLPITIQAN